MAEIGENITRNIKICEERKKEIQEFNGYIKDLGPKLMIPTEDLEQVQLNFPMTVCGDRNCCKKITVGGVTKTDYKQICHEHCYLRNVTTEVVGDQEIRFCDAFLGGHRNDCRRCRHTYQTHLHIRYETRVVTRELKDESVQQKITNKEEAKKAMQTLVNDLNVRINEMNAEKKTITDCLVRFAHFLSQNAITAFNDAYEHYLNYLITNGDGNESDLRQMLAQYHEEKNAFELLLANNLVDETEVITPQRINGYITELCGLKHSGPKIRHGLDIQQKSQEKESLFREVKHKVGATKGQKKTKTGFNRWFTISLE